MPASDNVTVKKSFFSLDCRQVDAPGEHDVDDSDISEYWSNQDFKSSLVAYLTAYGPSTVKSLAAHMETTCEMIERYLPNHPRTFVRLKPDNCKKTGRNVLVDLHPHLKV